MSRGSGPLVPAEPVWTHIDRLVKLNWTGVEIADAAGVTAETVQRIRKQRPAEIRTSSARAILAIPAEPRRYFSSAGLARRAEALLAEGWTPPMIAARSNIDPVSFRNVIQTRRASNRVGDALVAVYAALAGTPGPSVSGRLEALKKGYLPSAAWDGVDIDDPEAEPNPLAGAPDADPSADAGAALMVRQMRREEFRTELGWHDLAKCKGGPFELFFPDDLPRAKVEAAVATAKGYCRACPVRRICLETALADNDMWGVKGGMTEDERRREKRRRERKQAAA